MTPIFDPFEALRSCEVDRLPVELAKLGFSIEEKHGRFSCSVRVARDNHQGHGQAVIFLEALRRATDNFLEGL